MKIKSQSDALKLVEALMHSDYIVEVKPVFHEFPRSNDIKHYEVKITGMVGEGE